MNDAPITPRPQHNATLAVLTTACLAFAIQQTMVIPALPVLQRDLATTTNWATWVLTGFLLVAAVATPLIGRLGDQYGKDRLLVIALAVFLLGCVAAALALVHRYVPESPVKTPSSVDVPGALLLAGGLTSLLLALTEGDSWGWLSGPVVGLVALAAALLVALVLVELRVAEPLVDMR